MVIHRLSYANSTHDLTATVDGPNGDYVVLTLRDRESDMASGSITVTQSELSALVDVLRKDAGRERAKKNNA